MLLKVETRKRMSKTARVIRRAVIWDFMVRWQRTAMDRRLARIPTRATEKSPTPSVAKLYFRSVLYHLELQARKASSGVGVVVGSAGNSGAQSAESLESMVIFFGFPFSSVFAANKIHISGTKWEKNTY